MRSPRTKPDCGIDQSMPLASVSSLVLVAERPRIARGVPISCSHPRRWLCVPCSSSSPSPLSRPLSTAPAPSTSASPVYDNSFITSTFSPASSATTPPPTYLNTMPGVAILSQGVGYVLLPLSAFPSSPIVSCRFDLRDFFSRCADPPDSLY